MRSGGELMMLLEALDTMLGDIPRQTKGDRTGSHAHQCGACGHTFRHGNECFGDMEKHMCPKCGNGPWSFRLPGSERKTR